VKGRGGKDRGGKGGKGKGRREKGNGISLPKLGTLPPMLACLSVIVCPHAARCVVYPIRDFAANFVDDMAVCSDEWKHHLGDVDQLGELM